MATGISGVTMSVRSTLGRTRWAIPRFAPRFLEARSTPLCSDLVQEAADGWRAEIERLFSLDSDRWRCNFCRLALLAG